MHYGWILFLKAEDIKRIPLAITPHICGSRNAVNPTKNILTNCSSFPNPVNKPITTKRKIIPERNLLRLFSIMIVPLRSELDECAKLRNIKENACGEIIHRQILSHLL